MLHFYILMNQLKDKQKTKQKQKFNPNPTGAQQFSVIRGQCLLPHQAGA